MTIKGFENEDIKVSEFGEWVGNDYIDYKSDYKEHQKIINDLLKQRQELIEYLKEQLNECKLSGNDEDYVRADVYEEILSKIEKSDK
ncbi:MAG TPA: hypothetical protein IAB59_00195 [Candidatus Onthousia faecipullorum]|uniref:Uncharacterized protein n=1 Tax=Candidatus Onthousia faecipullorum TaxID=2840887 RepID=A0A9D1G971_9FIRM|nr:hypothetical protein [Candidatus Onthousia faecipullorum]